MSIGAGLALLGIWGFASACALSNRVTGMGMWLGTIAALVATYFVVVL